MSAIQARALTRRGLGTSIRQMFESKFKLHTLCWAATCDL